MLLALLTHDRRLHLFGRRVHHGLAGCALVLLGAALMADDALDCRRWWSDFTGRR